jgi:hypothetical protein
MLILDYDLFIIDTDLNLTIIEKPYLVMHNKSDWIYFFLLCYSKVSCQYLYSLSSELIK